MNMFECWICKEKADRGDNYTYPLTEIANPYDIKENWICKECYEDEKNDKLNDKNYEEFINQDPDWSLYE